jgi:CrcB protein
MSTGFAGILLVGAGGAAGSICRYLVSTFFGRFDAGRDLPYATFIANITGCLLIGMLFGAIWRHGDTGMKLLLVTGFCGGYTTFSTFALEGLQMLQSQRFAAWAVYAAGSVLLGIGAVAVGYCITRN